MIRDPVFLLIWAIFGAEQVMRQARHKKPSWLSFWILYAIIAIIG